MKFLETSDTIPEIRQLLGGAAAVRAAVAYWGDGAVEGMCITKDQDLIIVCDVLSGGCNPAEVRKLLRILGPKRVLTYDRLHAKVWLTDVSAVVGSSNASANGLGFEGKEANSLVEANIVVDAPEALAAMNKWWTEKILLAAREITEADLRRAKSLRARHRTIRPLARYPDLLAGLRIEPLSFKERGVRVWVWEHGEVDHWFENALEQAREQRGDDIECWQDVEDPPPPGSFVIDFSSEYDPPKLLGIYRILKDQPVYAVRQGTLLLCKQVKTFEGMPLGRQATWRTAARAALDANDGDAWDIYDFARFLPAPQS